MCSIVKLTFVTLITLNLHSTLVSGQWPSQQQTANSAVNNVLSSSVAIPVTSASAASIPSLSTNNNNVNFRTPTDVTRGPPQISSSQPSPSLPSLTALGTTTATQSVGLGNSNSPVTVSQQPLRPHSVLSAQAPRSPSASFQPTVPAVSTLSRITAPTLPTVTDQTSNIAATLPAGSTSNAGTVAVQQTVSRSQPAQPSGFTVQQVDQTNDVNVINNNSTNAPVRVPDSDASTPVTANNTATTLSTVNSNTEVEPAAELTVPIVTNTTLGTTNKNISSVTPSLTAFKYRLKILPLTRQQLASGALSTDSELSKQITNIDYNLQQIYRFSLMLPDEDYCGYVFLRYYISPQISTTDTANTNTNTRAANDTQDIKSLLMSKLGDIFFADILIPFNSQMDYTVSYECYQKITTTPVYHFNPQLQLKSSQTKIETNMTV